MTEPYAYTLVALLVGLCIGSFLNVVIHRLPKMLERDWRAQCAELRDEPVPDEPTYNLVVPRSACPSCGHRITALENIPVASWLALGGRCSSCNTRISARYPVVEILGGLLAAYAIFRFGATAKGLATCVLLWSLLALTMIDFDTLLLPDGMTIPLVWAGLVVNIGEMFVPLTSAVVGAIAGYITLWTVYWIFKLVRGKEGMGYGDFKLLAALGAWLGWQMLPLIVLLSSVVGAIIGIALIAFRGRDQNVPIPFGPYLAIAGVIAVFWGSGLTRLYVP
jgi:leader peptidase (prepilin peptidase)/N-methyltransferase